MVSDGGGFVQGGRRVCDRGSQKGDLQSSYCRRIYDITSAGTPEDRGYSREANSMTSTVYTARAALRVVKELVEARRIVGDLCVTAQENTVRIANLDEDRIVSPEANLAALDAAEAMERSLEKLRDIVSDALAVYKFGRDEDRDELVIRLEQEVREAGDADLVAYEDKVVRAIQVEGYIDRPRFLLDRYSETVRIGLKSGVGPGDCALRILDNYNEGVPEQAFAAIQAGLLGLDVEPKLDTEDAIVAALDACRTMEDVNGILSTAITACHGNRPNFDDEAELGPDSIAVLTDGAVLAWGRCGYHRGHDTRSLVVYETPDRYRTVLSLDRSAEIHDEDDRRHAA